MEPNNQVTPSINTSAPHPPTEKINTEAIQPSPPKLKSSHIIFTFLLILTVIVFSGGIGYFVYKNSKYEDLNSKMPSNKKEETPQLTTRFDNSIKVSSFDIGIPKEWKISISTKTSNVLAARMYPPSVKQDSTYLEVQVSATTDFSKNPTLEFASEKIIETPFKYTVRNGQEKLLQSNRLVTQWEVHKDGSQLLLTLFSASNDTGAIRPYVDQIVQRSLPPDIQGKLFVKPIYAQEDSTGSTESSVASVAGFPVDQWKTIEVMEGPYPERITTSDIPYKDGYARLYRFKALAGQRLSFLTEESQKSLKEVGSFLRQEYYDESGKEMTIGNTKGSILDSQPYPQSIWNYVLVRTFDRKQGEFLLKVMDLDQTQDLYYAHYSDGSEALINAISAGAKPEYKNQEAVLIIRFTSPIEIIGDNQVRYFRKPDDFCIICRSERYGDKTVPINVKVNQVEVPIKITKLFLNQALIQPISQEGFPKDSVIHFELDYGTDSTGVSSGYSNSFLTY